MPEARVLFCRGTIYIYINVHNTVFIGLHTLAEFVKCWPFFKLIVQELFILCRASGQVKPFITQLCLLIVSHHD